MSSAETVTIYVELLHEGVDVWRPVQAEPVQGALYRIVSANPDPELEDWAFASGQIVRCLPREFSGGERGLVAVEAVDE